MASSDSASTEELAALFIQVLEQCQQAGLVRLGPISLDGTKIRANASRHKAMSYSRMLTKQEVQEGDLRLWPEEGLRQDEEEDEEHGPDDDSWSLPKEAEMKVVRRKLEHIQAGKARLEAMFRAKAIERDKDPDSAEVPERAQTNFTRPGIAHHEDRGRLPAVLQRPSRSRRRRAKLSSPMI